MGMVRLVAFLGCVAVAQGAEDLTVVVRSGAHDRQDTPVRLEIPADRLPSDLVAALTRGPKAVSLLERSGGVKVTGQLDRPSDGSPRLTFLLPGRTPAGQTRRFTIESIASDDGSWPWAISEASEASIDLRNRDKFVFRYNRVPVSHPKYPAIQNRDAYIHPAHTPSGALITGDFSPSHPHHRGFFLAYARTELGDLRPDFWNIHNGTAKIHFDGLDAAVAGPVTARLVTRHRWEAKGAEGPVLQERWEVEAYDVPGTPFWMFDVTSTQRAVDRPLVLPPYRYGGMAYRGPEPFVKGALGVLTSEGHDNRKTADQKPARWIDLTGPVAEGSDQYGGAVMFDHPTNLNHPSVVRIHPTSLPFFSFVPSHDTRVTIPADRPIVFRYRVVIHDGRPDRALDQRLWHDYSEPPTAEIGARPTR
ncbi:MAG: PmoA family protein [Isosphaeraceae bacterium]